MNPSTPFRGIHRIKLFLALSRTPHGVLDMAAPAFAALLWLGAIPPVRIVVLGLAATLAGYTAVYAVNDVVGYRSDRKKFLNGGFGGEDGDLDALLVRHPLAQGYLGLGEAAAWALGWALVAVACAYRLNPMCVVIFAGGCLLETAYCLLWRVSPYRAVISGAVKTLGAVAAVFAVDPNPSPAPLCVLFACFFLWEIGGQNVPNDWTDIDDDRRFGGRTNPVRFGKRISAEIILWSLAGTSVLGPMLFALRGGPHAPIWAAATATTGLWLLIRPAVDLYRTAENTAAMALFNRASHFPAALLILALLRVITA